MHARYTVCLVPVSTDGKKYETTVAIDIVTIQPIAISLENRKSVHRYEEESRGDSIYGLEICLKHWYRGHSSAVGSPPPPLILCRNTFLAAKVQIQDFHSLSPGSLGHGSNFQISICIDLLECRHPGIL